MANSEYSITESSISNTVSKDSVNEEMSLSLASLEDAAGFSANGRKPETISNEKILKGDELLETYRVTSDAVHGGIKYVSRRDNRPDQPDHFIVPAQYAVSLPLFFGYPGFLMSSCLLPAVL